MRRTLLLLVLAACHKKAAAPQTTAAKLPVPTVAVADEIATPQGALPVLVFVDSAGKTSLAVPPSSWAALGSVDVTKGKPVALDELDQLIRVGKLEKWTPKQLVDHVGKEADLALADLGATGDDPPPPPEEEEEDESGGTGTAMALDDKPPAPKDPRAEHVAAAGGFRASVFASLGGGGEGAVAGGFGSNDGYGPGPVSPERAAGVGGEALKGEPMPPQQAVLFIDPHAKLKALLDTIAFSDGAIAVVHDGKVGVLRLNFAIAGHRDYSMFDDPPWIEVRALPGGQLELEAVPDKPVTLDKIDAIKAALPKLVADTKLDPWNPVDVLVPPDTDVQHVIDLVVAVDQAGAHSIGIGEMPDAKQLALRGHVIRRFSLGVPNVMGDLDKALVRHEFKRHVDDLRACYDKALEGNATLKGTVLIGFVITKTGGPKDVKPDGGDPALGACFADITKKMKFPAPNGGGNVDVMYPISYAPSQRL